MPSLRNRGLHSTLTRPPAVGHADVEGGRAEMPIVRDAAILTAGAHDQAHDRAADRSLRLGASGRGEAMPSKRNGPSEGVR
jgi:hypothetical protein